MRRGDEVAAVDPWELRWFALMIAASATREFITDCPEIVRAEIPENKNCRLRTDRSGRFRILF
jgi:hypothetical protein